MGQSDRRNYLLGAKAASYSDRIDTGSNQRLNEDGYWPARAAQLLEAKEFAQVIALCRERLDEQAHVWSGRIIYALALYYTGQLDGAERQFQQVLAWDPDNLVALKGLGDIRNSQDDWFGALSLYHRVLEIDPDCRGLKSDLDLKSTTTTRTISLKRSSESIEKQDENLPEVPFFTETIGDLYLSQGHARMAARVFRHLFEQDQSPRWQEKLEQAERRQTGSRSGSKP